LKRVFRTISVIGLGYIGLPTAAMFASRKIRVIGVDTNAKAVDTINAGRVHIVEPDLDIVVRAAVEQGYLRATTVPEAAEAFLIAVPTPFRDGHEPDLSFIEAAAKAIAPVLAPGNIVVLESTSPVGATEQMADWLAAERPDLTFPQSAGDSSDIRIAYCPERVLPGNVMRELVDNDRLVGGLSARCSEVATSLYKSFVRGACVVTHARTAEMAKLTENSFRDVNIAFANELSVICDKLGVDVWELIELANLHPRVNILQPGPGVGGHCIAVDPWFIVAGAPEEARLIRTAREVNDAKPHWVVRKVEEAVARHLEQHKSKAPSDVRIACYGLSFKPDIDDLRESPAVDIATALAEVHPGPIMAVEPNITRLANPISGVELVSEAAARSFADVHVLLVDHRAFDRMPPESGELVDARGVWTCSR
jgi:UDP-N-acetyl-D-mannosaminuronic acid dehydrogenase